MGRTAAPQHLARLAQEEKNPALRPSADRQWGRGLRPGPHGTHATAQRPRRPPLSTRPTCWAVNGLVSTQHGVVQRTCGFQPGPESKSLRLSEQPVLLRTAGSFLVWPSSEALKPPG